MTNIRDKLNKGHYKSKLPYPERIVREPKLGDLKGKSPEVQIQMMKNHEKALLEYPARLETYQAEIKAYREDEGRLREEFKQDLFEELGITQNPKREALWSKAWGEGHHAGLGEVLSEASDLVDLIL